MKIVIFCFVVCLSVFLFSGCILPIPHFSHTCYPIYGYVTTTDPNVPIEGATVKVRYSDNGRRKTKTDKLGYFSFPQKKEFHFFAVAPNDYNLGSNSATLKIKADGYNERSVSLSRFMRYSDDSNIYMNGYFTTPAGDYIIPLNKTERQAQIIRE